MTSPRNPGPLWYRMMNEFLWMFAMCSAELWAQSQAVDANVEGVVRARDGVQISGAVVKISNQGTGLVREAKTNEQGQYRLQLLPVGNYSVSVAKEGFSNPSAVSAFAKSTSTACRITSKAERAT